MLNVRLVCRYFASRSISGPSSNPVIWRWRQLIASWWCTRGTRRRRRDEPAAASSTASSIYPTPSTRRASPPAWSQAADWSSRRRSHPELTSDHWTIQEIRKMNFPLELPSSLRHFHLATTKYKSFLKGLGLATLIPRVRVRSMG